MSAPDRPVRLDAASPVGGGDAARLDPARYRTLLRLARDPEHRLVLSLGGGSIPGLSGNLALVRMIEELGLRHRIAEVWGTSAGAAIGAAFASGAGADEIERVVKSLDRRGTVDIPWGRLALSFLFKPFGGALPDGLMRGERIQRAIAQGLKAERIEDCEIPFRAIACTDDGHATRKVFRRGPLKDAVFYSMSLPGIVVPRRVGLAADEPGYYDGGLVEKTPLLSPIADHMRLHPGKKLVLLGTHYASEVKRVRARGFIRRFLQSMNALENLAWGYQLAEARGRKNVLVLILNPRIDDPEMFNFARLDQNVRHARAAFAAQLEDARIGLVFGVE